MGVSANLDVGEVTSTGTVPSSACLSGLPAAGKSHKPKPSDSEYTKFSSREYAKIHLYIECI